MRQSKFFILLAGFSLAALVAFSACVVEDVAIEDSDTWTCQSDEHCLSGFSCINGACSKAGPVLLCNDEDQDNYRTGSECSDEVLDCDDHDRNVNPGASEICNNVDDDCNDLIDDDITEACPLTQGVCAVANAVQTCEAGVLTPDCASLYGSDYSATEICGDNLDNDCNGEPDDGCPSCVEGTECGNISFCAPAPAVCACKMGTQTCQPDGTLGDCLDNTGQPIVFPFIEQEICGNNIDDNCTGEVDEGCP